MFPTSWIRSPVEVLAFQRPSIKHCFCCCCCYSIAVFFIAKIPWQRNSFTLHQINTEMLQMKILAVPLPQPMPWRAKDKVVKLQTLYIRGGPQTNSIQYFGRKSLKGSAGTTEQTLRERIWMVGQLQFHNREALSFPASLPPLCLLELSRTASTENGVYDPASSTRQ